MEKKPIIKSLLMAGIFFVLLCLNSTLLAAETFPGTGGEIQPPQDTTNLPPLIVWATHQKPNAGFTEPDPLDFSNHVGYVSLFDGVDLKGWDGCPKFWRVEDGAIVGQSSPQNPCQNTYLAYRGMQARDFTLKFEMKVVGEGGSGFQYRSQTGMPWLSRIQPEVISNTGPLNLSWMMTGPQADFWDSSKPYTGQFYSENTPMRIVSWRGQVVDSYGAMTKVLMGNIGDREVLGRAEKDNDWNQYTVIVRGHTFIHIINGQLMSVLVDDDPASSNNQAGLFGIELESYTELYVRNIWVEKLD
ncbi:MAG: DUF1080 domain-containing protein [Verrucomicrobiota bacterium]